MNFEFIKEHFFRKLIGNERYGFNENSLLTEMKKLITIDKNLFFVNNNFTWYVLNLNKFESFDIEDFETGLDRRCEMEDLECQKIYSSIIDNENDIFEYLSQQLEFKERLSKVSVEDLVTSFKPKETVIIDDFNSVLYFILRAPSFKTIAVDLEGSLVRKAEIDLIQIFDGTQTFIVDYYKINVLLGDEFLKRLLKISLTFVFEYEKILKLFHDGRNDCLALHSVFKICTINYIDMGNLFSFIKQVKYQTNFFEAFKDTLLKDPKIDVDYANMLSFVSNATNPGLNKVLEEYETNHKINHLKDKIHAMFNNDEYRKNFFLKRPMEEEWLNYCVLDVKYLIHTFQNMLKEIEILLKKFYNKGIKHDEALLLARLLSNGHCKYSCEIFKG